MLYILQEKAEALAQRTEEYRQRIANMAAEQRPHQERLAAASAEIKRINASKADHQVLTRVSLPKRVAGTDGPPYG